MAGTSHQWEKLTAPDVANRCGLRLRLVCLGVAPNQNNLSRSRSLWGDFPGRSALSQIIESSRYVDIQYGDFFETLLLLVLSQGSPLSLSPVDSAGN